MTEDETTPYVLKKIRRQLDDIKAEQPNIAAMIAIHGTLLDLVRSELKQMRTKVDKLARSKPTMRNIDLISAELDRLEQQFTSTSKIAH